MLFLVYDTETTGLPPTFKSLPRNDTINTWPYIVQISYIVYDTERSKVITISDSIIRVPNNVTIPKETSLIHGITNDISKREGIPIENAICDFINWVKMVDIVIAHNYEFDKKMILAEILRLPGNTGLELTRKKIYTETIITKNNYCTMLHAKKVCNIKAYTKRNKKEYIKYPTLTETCQHLYNFKPSNMHNSLNDVIACTLCFYKLYYNKDILLENNNFNNMVNTIMPL